MISGVNQTPMPLSGGSDGKCEVSKKKFRWKQELNLELALAIRNEK